MLSSVEHEILNAHKYKNIEKLGFLLGSDKPGMLFFMLMNSMNHSDQPVFSHGCLLTCIDHQESMGINQRL